VKLTEASNSKIASIHTFWDILLSGCITTIAIINPAVYIQLE